MAKLLIHIHSGPELKNKLTLGLLVAKTGVAEGHNVKLFLAADAVYVIVLAKDLVATAHPAAANVLVMFGDDHRCGNRHCSFRTDR